MVNPDSLTFCTVDTTIKNIITFLKNNRGNRVTKQNINLFI